MYYGGWFVYLFIFLSVDIVVCIFLHLASKKSPPPPLTPCGQVEFYCEYAASREQEKNHSLAEGRLLAPVGRPRYAMTSTRTGIKVGLNHGICQFSANL